MQEKTVQPNPKARQIGVVVEKLEGEVLVYDLETHKAHCLNPVAGLVWQHCDGQTTVPQLMRLAQQEMAAPVDEAVIWLALDQLGKAHLLDERVTRPAHMQFSRRELMRTAGAVAAAALVTSIVAPTAAQAMTGLANGQSCTSSMQCISGNCASNVCAP